MEVVVTATPLALTTNIEVVGFGSEGQSLKMMLTRSMMIVAVPAIGVGAEAWATEDGPTTTAPSESAIAAHELVIFLKGLMTTS
jgi:hypothetical protein